jgi:type II restriction enzyme
MPSGRDTHLRLNLPVPLAQGYKSASQRARRLTEGWLSKEGFCPNCSGRLIPLKANAPTSDFRCSKCRELFQLKSQSRPFGSRLLGAEYQTTLAAARSGRSPSLVLLHYDPHALRVVDLEFIHNSWITESAIVPRPPLRPPARRAGWQGCTLALDRVPAAARIPVISQGKPIPRRTVQSKWGTARKITDSSGSSRSWIADVLSVIDRLPPQFALADIYQFENQLAKLHPANKNVRPKIRQQLQVARDLGLLRFTGAGRYAKT